MQVHITTYIHLYTVRILKYIEVQHAVGRNRIPKRSRNVSCIFILRTLQSTLGELIAKLVERDKRLLASWRQEKAEQCWCLMPTPLCKQAARMLTFCLWVVCSPWHFGLPRIEAKPSQGPNRTLNLVPSLSPWAAPTFSPSRPLCSLCLCVCSTNIWTHNFYQFLSSELPQRIPALQLGLIQQRLEALDFLGASTFSPHPSTSMTQEPKTM